MWKLFKTLNKWSYLDIAFTVLITITDWRMALHDHDYELWPSLIIATVGLGLAYLAYVEANASYSEGFELDGDIVDYRQRLKGHLFLSPGCMVICSAPIVFGDLFTQLTGAVLVVLLFLGWGAVRSLFQEISGSVYIA